MDQPLISIVVPIYNVEEYLERCIQSIVNQTYLNLEIILVDDGSPDKCPGICDSWASKDARIKVIHKQNAGLGMARNSGIEIANGKYIFFIDSDDYIDIHTVEKCVKDAEENTSDAVMFGRWDVFADGKIKPLPISVTKSMFRDEEVRRELLPKLFTYEYGIGVSACGAMYNLKTIKLHGLRFVSERELISEDAFFALEFYSVASVVTFVTENFYFYYKRGNSLSRLYMDERQKKNDIFLEKCLKYIEQTGLPKTVSSHLKVRYHFYTIAAMKQIMICKLNEEQKKTKLWEIFSSPVLYKTITIDVLRLETFAQKLFFCILKLRGYLPCFWMLKYKMRDS